MRSSADLDRKLGSWIYLARQTRYPMKETDKDYTTQVAEKMLELQEKGRRLKEKEDRFRSSLGTRLKTPSEAKKK